MTKQNNNALVDTREPKLGKFAIFTIYKLIGFQWINILIGSVCNSGIGVVQIIFFFIIGGIVDVISVGNENGQPLTPQEIRTQINYLAMWIAIFYKPTSGNVYLDGVDINEIDPKWLHKSIAIVSQEPVLFGTTIAHNIAYAVGLENVTQKQIEDAAKEANAHNFIMDLPDGYNTKVSEKGVSLSGGQKQRIAIARAVLQNPNLLLLDEATSALDTESEAMVQESLNRIMKGRTSICIAHRLTTIKNCDHIYVLEKGELKEEGVHDELLKIENGVYRKFAEKQMKFGENTPIDTTDEIHRKSWRDSVYIKTLFTN
ncbi:hypothetical protein ABK040_005065 [Willaertia magna]